MGNGRVLSFRITRSALMVAVAAALFGGGPASLVQAADASSQKQEVTGAFQPVAAELQELVKKYYPKATLTATPENVHFEHKVKMRSTYYGDRPETLYQGIYGDISVAAGKYAQTAREMPGETRNIVDTTLLLTPYCRPKNAHLIAKLVFPDDVPPAFKEQYAKVIKGFASEDAPAPGSAAAKAEAEAAAPPVAAVPADTTAPPAVTTTTTTTTTTTETGSTPSAPKGPLPFFAKVDAASGLPSNLFILEPQQTSPAHDVPAGSYWLWKAKKVGNDPSAWDWQRHGPYNCDTATRYVIHNSASVFCKAESDGNLASIKGGLTRICVQNPLGAPFAFILDNTIDASLRKEPKH